jgi:hypothetical protein
MIHADKSSLESFVYIWDDCFLIMSNVVPRDLFCLTLVIVTVLEYMLNAICTFGQLLQELS